MVGTKRVQFEELHEAEVAYLWGIHGMVMHFTLELQKAFRDYVGITDSQHEDYMDGMNLYVTRKTYKKIKVLIEYQPKHWNTLFKIIEARSKWK